MIIQPPRTIEEYTTTKEAIESMLNNKFATPDMLKALQIKLTKIEDVIANLKLNNAR